MSKLKYEYEPWPRRPNMPTFCDVYVCGQKVSEGHDATRNHVYVNVDESITVADIKLKPYDPRVELRNQMKDGVLVVKKPRKKCESKSLVADGSTSFDVPELSSRSGVSKVK